MAESSSTQLAGMLGVSVSTVTRWTELEIDPLRFTARGNSRQIDFDDYADFRRAHPHLRKAGDLDQPSRARPIPAVESGKLEDMALQLEATTRLLQEALRTVSALQRDVTRLDGHTG